MRISELAQRTGVSADRLRHYHALGLIKAKRSAAGYRDFSENTVREVIFIAKCREVGVSLREIGKIVPGYRVGTLTFNDMIELMGDQIQQVDQQITELRNLRRELSLAARWFKTKKKDLAKAKDRKKSKSNS